MLGEQIGEIRGKRVVRRVLSSDPAKVEVTIEETGKIIGVDISDFGTYSSQIRDDGSLYGEGEGLMTTATGDMVSWKGSGLGKFTATGGVSYRGILYFRTKSPKLARLNGVAGVFEYEVDAKGESQTKIWEWK